MLCCPFSSERLEDTKRVTIRRNSTDKECNGQMKKGKRTKKKSNLIVFQTVFKMNIT
jgi:hypothetical protein